MPSHVDILDQPERLGKPLLGSVVLHVAVFAAILAASLASSRSTENWGSINGGGGSVGVSVVKEIPLPARSGPVNPVANDTESMIPQPPPEPKKETVKPPEPD